MCRSTCSGAHVILVIMDTLTTSRRCAQHGRLAAVLFGCLALPTVFAKDAAPRADAGSAVIFGTSSTTRVGPPVAVDILRVNDEEYFVELHWAQRKFWRVRPGEVWIKLNCSVFYKAGFTRLSAGGNKLLKATLEAGHYYQFTCEDLQPDYVDRGTDATAIPELVAR
jgi:hypothetical protein